VSVLTGIRATVSPATRILYAKGCEVEGDSTEDIKEAVRIARGRDCSRRCQGGR
jgi:beta-glucosidase